MMHPIRTSKGQASVELSFTLIFFFAVLLTIADVSRIAYAWTTLQFVVNEGSRWGVAQQTTTQRAQNTKTHIITKGSQLLINVNNVTIYPSDGAMDDTVSQSFLRIRATAAVPLTPVSATIASIAGNHAGTYTVSAETLIRNETP